MDKPERLLQELVKLRKTISAAELRTFIAHYSSLSDSALADELTRVKAMFGLGAKKKTSLTPPAGLKAKEAVPIVLAYVREEKGQPISLSKEERGSFGAMVEALDRRFGAGFTKRVIEELNALPNGSHSLHYKR